MANHLRQSVRKASNGLLGALDSSLIAAQTSIFSDSLCSLASEAQPDAYSSHGQQDACSPHVSLQQQPPSWIRPTTGRSAALNSSHRAWGDLNRQKWGSTSSVPVRSFARASRLKNAKPLSVRGRKVDADFRDSKAQSASQTSDSVTIQEDVASDGKSDAVSQPENQEDAIQTSPATDTQVANVLRNPALIVTRNVEWGTVIFGFEQQNKYTVLDQDGNTVALLAEDAGGFGKQVGRQFLRTRRSFTATILTPEGNVILKLRRPAYLINSNIFIENAHGEVIGEVKQRWHLWQRNYDVYLDRQQIAAINSPLLAWEFALKDEKGGVLALIDRNFQGFGKELFTDAGKYVIHFGDKPQDAAEQIANSVQAAHPDKPRPDVTKLAQYRTEVAVIPTATGNALEVVRPLSIDERTLVLATAVSIDFDYFSQHSHGSGLMPFLMPIPMPNPGYPENGEIPDPGTGSPDDISSGAEGSAQVPDQAGDSRTQTFDDEAAFQDSNTVFDEPDFGSNDTGNDNAGWGEDSGFGDSGGGDEEGGGLWDLAKGFFEDD